jgi:hypothetical protein
MSLVPARDAIEEVHGQPRLVIPDAVGNLAGASRRNPSARIALHASAP